MWYAKHGHPLKTCGVLSIRELLADLLLNIHKIAPQKAHKTLRKGLKIISQLFNHVLMPIKSSEAHALRAYLFSWLVVIVVGHKSIKSIRRRKWNHISWSPEWGNHDFIASRSPPQHFTRPKLLGATCGSSELCLSSKILLFSFLPRLNYSTEFFPPAHCCVLC